MLAIPPVSNTPPRHNINVDNLTWRAGEANHAVAAPYHHIERNLRTLFTFEPSQEQLDRGSISQGVFHGVILIQGTLPLPDGPNAMDFSQPPRAEGRGFCIPFACREAIPSEPWGRCRHAQLRTCRSTIAWTVGEAASLLRLIPISTCILNPSTSSPRAHAGPLIPVQIQSR